MIVACVDGDIVHSTMVVRVFASEACDYETSHVKIASQLSTLAGGLSGR